MGLHRYFVRRLTVTQRHFTDVWYTTEDQIMRPRRNFSYRIKGTLELLPDGFVLRYEQLALPIWRIRSVTLTRQQLPWIDYLVGGAIYLLLFLGGESLASSLPFAALMASIAVLIWALGDWNTKWVRVEYLDERNYLSRTYFAEASHLGLGGIFGGTERLYESLRTRLNAEVTAGAHQIEG